MVEAARPIEVRGLTKVYRLGFLMNRRVHELRGIDLAVEPGQVFGLLGPNGAGKSTTIKILMNLVRATSGEARLFGASPASHLARRPVGFLPENPAPYEYLTGREFVTLAGALGGLRGSALERRTAEVLELVHMSRAADLQIRRYSKGMTQRISLAQAVIHQPQVLILDEPTSGMDPIGRRQIRELIEHERARGTTVLFCTHIISDVEALCDRAAILVGGRVRRAGTLRELLETEAPTVQLVAEGIAAADLQPLEADLEGRELTGTRLVAQVKEARAGEVLQHLLSRGARVIEVRPARSSLEEVFLKAVAEAGGDGVGGEIA